MPKTLNDTIAELYDGAEPSTVGEWDRRAGAFNYISTKQFGRDIIGAAGRLYDQKITPGEPLLIVGRTPRQTLTLYLAAVAAGATPAIVPFRPGLDSGEVTISRLQAAARPFGGRARLYGTIKEATAQAAGLAAISADGQDDRPRNLDSLCAPVAHDTPASMQYTSGSTGDSKLVVLTHGAIAHNLEDINGWMGYGPDVPAVNWLPLYHDFGLIFGCLAPLANHSPLLLLSPFDFLRNPLDWLSAIHTSRAQITAAPNSALRQTAEKLAGASTRDGHLRDLDLSCLRLLCVGAEPIHAETLRSFAAAAAPYGLASGALRPGYGLAEAVLAATFTETEQARCVTVARDDLLKLGKITPTSSGDIATRPENLTHGQVELVSSGRERYVPIHLVDQQGQTITEENMCGEIVITGPTVTQGYRHGDGTLEPFNGTLHTGDIAFISAGQLYIIDRVKNVIIRNGENMSVTGVENIVATASGTRTDQMVCFQIVATGEIVLVAEHDGHTPEEILTKLVDARAHTNTPIDRIVIVKERAIPRTTSGKRRHSDTRALLVAGKLEVLTEWIALSNAAGGHDDDDDDDDRAKAAAHPGGSTSRTRHSREAAQVIAMVAELAASNGHQGPVTEDSILAGELDIDSLSLFELAVRIEEQLGVAVGDEALAGVITVGDIIAIVETGGSATGLAEDIARFAESIPGLYMNADAQNGRDILIDGRWMADFASCNYLGYDLSGEIADAIGPMISDWGVHPSWTRAVCSPKPYAELERALAEAAGVDDTLVFATVTLLHQGVMPLLAGAGSVLLLDSAVHHSVQEAAVLCKHAGSAVSRYPHNNFDELERKLRQASTAARRVIAVDGVYSMSGSIVNLPKLLALAETYDAVIYIDDAHGFGVLGTNPTQTQPYGSGGGGVCRWWGVNSDRIVYVGGMSKAFSTMAAFLTVGGPLTRQQLHNSSTQVFSGPIPTASLASGIKALEISARDDSARDQLAALTRRLTSGLADAGYDMAGHSGFPIVNVVIGGITDTLAGLHRAHNGGLITTPAVYPAAPLQAGGLRFSVTAANTEAQIDRAISIMADARHKGS